MKLKEANLVEWLRRQKVSEFPGGRGYFRSYEALEEYLTKEVHPFVGVGAALRSGVFLNDHGPDHVRTVVERASKLVAAASCDLSAYEVYLLLAAIQVHDAGNIMGRPEHEQQLKKWQGTLEQLLGSETIERRMVLQIAQAHGGTSNGDKDTISRLELQSILLGKEIRPRLLAAILRFADELADDRTRASRFAIEQGAIPEKGLIFHKYSEALHSVIVDVKGGTIALIFEITDKDATRLFAKDAGKIYLLDEIISRSLKMHTERIYCSRFLRPHINLDTISVKIEVYGSTTPEAKYGDTLVTVAYRLEDRGYPESNLTLLEMVPDLQDWYDGAPLSGITLADRLQQRNVT